MQRAACSDLSISLVARNESTKASDERDRAVVLLHAFVIIIIIIVVVVVVIVVIVTSNCKRSFPSLVFSRRLVDLGLGLGLTRGFPLRFSLFSFLSLFLCLNLSPLLPRRTGRETLATASSAYINPR